jgi:hypothetical protein
MKNNSDVAFTEDRVSCAQAGLELMEMESHELFALVGLEPRFSQSQPPN